jgi:hypothetical protein
MSDRLRLVRDHHLHDLIAQIDEAIDDAKTLELVVDMWTRHIASWSCPISATR